MVPTFLFCSNDLERRQLGKPQEAQRCALLSPGGASASAAGLEEAPQWEPIDSFVRFQFQQELPRGDNSDGAGLPGFAACDYGLGLRPAFLGGLFECRELSFLGLGCGETFAHLHEPQLPIGPFEGEINLAPIAGPVVIDSRSCPAQRSVDQILEQVARPRDDSGRRRCDECVVDAVDLPRVGVPSSDRWVVKLHLEQEERVLEPVDEGRHQHFWNGVPHCLEVAGQAVDRV